MEALAASLPLVEFPSSSSAAAALEQVAGRERPAFLMPSQRPPVLQLRDPIMW